MGKFGICKTRGKTLNEDGGRDGRLNTRRGNHVSYMSNLREATHAHRLTKYDRWVLDVGVCRLSEA